MTSRDEQLRYRVREPAGDPAGALVLFHGRGADENDLFPLFDILDPSRRLLGLAIRGPLTLPGLPGAHWYVIGRPGSPNPETFVPTAAAVGRWLDAIPENFGVPLDRVVLGGFSQGAAMTYALALHVHRQRPPAVIALSGFIPTVEAEGYDLELSNLGELSAAIGHGTLDHVIDVEWGRAARDRLEGAGASVLYRESPMGHTIDPDFLQELVPWLEDRTPR
ncbi:MAG: phospholipase [Actinomycetota bacterium]|nr:phospholipase [Actinomycetota bacterium]